MSPSTRHRLLEDTLHPDALAASLAATRRTARHRRLTRHAVRVGAGGALIAAAVLALLRSPQPSGVVGAPVTTHPISAEPEAASHVLVTTRKADAPILIRTATAPAVTRTSGQGASGVQIVSTRSTSPTVTRATEADLFAAAGPRPAALHRLPNGSALWVWLDRDTLR